MNDFVAWLSPLLDLLLQALIPVLLAAGSYLAKRVADWLRLAEDDRVRVAAPLTDILLIAPCENGRTNATPMAGYAEQMRQAAYAKRCAFLDLQYVFGETFAEYASTSPRNWFNSDLIHPEPATGGRAIVDAVLRTTLYS